MRGILYDDVQRAAGTTAAAAAAASVTHLKQMSGLNNTSNLTARLRDLETQVLFLQDMLKESGNLMMGIVKGTILVDGCPSSNGTGTAVDFGGYKAV